MTTSDGQKVVDPELAKILHKRRSIHGELPEEIAEELSGLNGDTAGRARPISAAEEIELNLR